MSKSLSEIAQLLSTPSDIKKTVTKKTLQLPKVQLIFAFNGTGKTRLSREFKKLIAPKEENEEISDDTIPWLAREKILYYNAFTEDLFYWDNDLANDTEPKLRIQPNTFTDWILVDQGQDQNIIANFQRYTNDKLTPRFNEEYLIKGEHDREIVVQAFSEVTFSMQTGDDRDNEKLKISKGEESNFIWSIFYAMLEQIIGVLKEPEPNLRETNQFDQLEYVFIDDPVSSLDENHLIRLAVDLAQLIKSDKSEIKFIITTHNPLFYNVISNELNRIVKKYRMTKQEDGTYKLENQSDDSPFSYHLYLKSELEKAIVSGQVSKYHFNFLRNILEKTSTFLGYEKWGDLLPKNNDGKPNPYETRILNLSSHSKHSGEEVAELTDDDKRVLVYLVREINKIYQLDNQKDPIVK